jgi:hypothetical protein
MPKRPSASSLKLCAIRVIGQHFTLIAYGCRSLEQVIHECTSTGASVNIRIFWDLSCLISDPIQGGSDISGTLSKLHCRIKKHLFINSFASNRLTYLPNKYINLHK